MKQDICRLHFLHWTREKKQHPLSSTLNFSITDLIRPAFPSLDREGELKEPMACCPFSIPDSIKLHFLSLSGREKTPTLICLSFSIPGSVKLDFSLIRQERNRATIFLWASQTQTIPDCIRLDKRGKMQQPATFYWHWCTPLQEYYSCCTITRTHATQD